MARKNNCTETEPVLKVCLEWVTTNILLYDYFRGCSTSQLDIWKIRCLYENENRKDQGGLVLRVLINDTAEFQWREKAKGQ